MKKNLALALCAACLLAGCSLSTPADSSAGPAEVTVAPQEERLYWSSVYYTGTTLGPGCTSETGYYYATSRLSPAGGGYVLCYVDFETARQAPVCASPNCTHDSESCTAFLPAADGGMPMPIFAGDKLVLQYGGGVGTAPKVEVMGLDGTGRHKVCDLPSGVMWGSSVPSSEALYIVGLAYTYSGEGEQKQVEGCESKLYRVSLTDGAMTEVYTFPENTNDILLLDVRDGQMIFRTTALFSIDDYASLSEAAAAQETVFLAVTPKGESRELWRAPGNLGGMSVWDGVFYRAESDWRTLYIRDLLTGDERTYTPDLPLDRGEVQYLTVTGCYGDWLALDVSFTGGAGYSREEDTLGFACNIATGEVRERTLRVLAKPELFITVPLPVMTRIGGTLLVENDRIPRQQTYQGSDGIPYYATNFSERWALMSLEDYLSSTPNYRDVAPLVE